MPTSGGQNPTGAPTKSVGGPSFTRRLLRAAIVVPGVTIAAYLAIIIYVDGESASGSWYEAFYEAALVYGFLACALAVMVGAVLFALAVLTGGWKLAAGRKHLSASGERSAR